MRCDLREALLAIIRAQHGRKRHIDKIRISQPHHAVGEGELGRLGDVVHKFKGIRCVLLKFGVAKDGQLLQEGRTLRPGATFSDGVAAKLNRDRFVIGGLPFRKVLVAQQAFVAFTRGISDFGMRVVVIDRVGYEASIPNIESCLDLFDAIHTALMLGQFNDLAVGCRDRLGLKQRAGRRDLVVGEPDVTRAVPLGTKQVLYGGDGLHHPRNEREALFCVMDSGR